MLQYASRKIPYKRLNCGISSASELFQETIRNVIQDIDHVNKTISDVILVYGENPSEHDSVLEKVHVFCRLNEKGLTVNKQKCELNKNNITFFSELCLESKEYPIAQQN